jgi:hypothetical protein
MNFLASPLGVFLILGLVAVAVFTFEPARYVGVWKEIAKRYETDQQPPSIQFMGEGIFLGAIEVTRIDATVEEEGFWMIYPDPAEKKEPGRFLIPWDCVRFKEEKDTQHVFQIRLNGPVDLFVSNGLGTAMRRKSQEMPPGVE